ncbi:hypothetical protein BV25DRAFT_1912140 [Artomyces pyxidatus]|uniref:Uncharacterized protein n=1 Tax=Artomyces pyxidatus TaxID=48021 RepID=A0ACB8TGL3_9AGAM|nr:hypothetical protein BV25DRAFT_1912140 [Artomyces pyxidatus]
MFSLNSLVVFAAFALSVVAVPHEARGDLLSPSPTSPAALCPSPTIVSSTQVAVGSNTVTFETLGCPATVTSDKAPGILSWLRINCFPWFPPKPITKTVTATATVTDTVTVAAPTPTLVDVTSAPCNIFCGDMGVLPPISDDCAVIENSITILNGVQPATFIVAPSHIQQLTFGTCRVFFENIGGNDLQYTWIALNSTATTAANACFPPVQPVNSLGMCQATDFTWEVGITHS